MLQLGEILAVRAEDAGSACAGEEILASCSSGSCSSGRLLRHEQQGGGARGCCCSMGFHEDLSAGSRNFCPRSIMRQSDEAGEGGADALPCPLHCMAVCLHACPPLREAIPPGDLIAPCITRVSLGYHLGITPVSRLSCLGLIPDISVVQLPASFCSRWSRYVESCGCHADGLVHSFHSRRLILRWIGGLRVRGSAFTFQVLGQLSVVVVCIVVRLLFYSIHIQCLLHLAVEV